MAERKAHLGWWAGERFWQCTTEVPWREGWGYSQCAKKAKYDPDSDGNPTKCGTHCAAAVERRRAKMAARVDARMALYDRQNQQSNLKKEALEIIRRIAEGHNDPRSLCMDWVKRYDETKEPRK